MEKQRRLSAVVRDTSAAEGCAVPIICLPPTASRSPNTKIGKRFEALPRWFCRERKVQVRPFIPLSVPPNNRERESTTLPTERKSSLLQRSDHAAVASHARKTHTTSTVPVTAM